MTWQGEATCVSDDMDRDDVATKSVPSSSEFTFTFSRPPNPPSLPRRLKP